MKWNLESFESAKVLFEYAQKAMIIDGLFMGTDDPIRQEDYMVQYDELFNALRLAAAKAVGSGALKLLGIEQEIDVRSPSDICSMLGKLDIIASKRIPNYTEEYFAHVA